MRLSQAPPTLLSLLITVISQSQSATAKPFAFNFLEKRTGNCGADLQFTCASDEGCFTTNNIAFCSSTGAGGGGFAVYTTTYVETDLVTRTSTYTSVFPAVTTNPNAIVATCSDAPTEYSCGPICCASTQGCAALGTCSEGAPSTLWSYASMPVPTVTNTITSGSVALRPTSGSLTATITSATTTTGFLSPVTASGSTLPVAEHHSKGLSAGAIAGIVIGVIGAIIILFIICFCCVGIQIFEAILRLFGIGSKKRRTTERTEVVERYSRHGSGSASRRETHSSWLGRPSRPSEREKKKSGGLGGLGAIGAGLAGLALILGLKRRHDRKKAERSDISSSYYTDSYTGTSASSASSRTRDSRRHR